MTRGILAVAFALALPGAARGHGVEHEVQDRGASMAVRARYHGGRPLAGAAYVVIAPGRPERIHAEGRTGPDGWLEFTPDAPGTWRVRIADASGHGGVFEVVARPLAPPEAPPPAAAAAAVPPPAGAPPPPGSTPVAAASPAPGPAPTTAPAPRAGLRTIAAAAAIVAAFAVLRAVHRRRAGAR